MDIKELNIYNDDTIEENEARSIEFKIKNDTAHERTIRNDIPVEMIMEETNSLE